MNLLIIIGSILLCFTSWICLAEFLPPVEKEWENELYPNIFGDFPKKQIQETKYKVKSRPDLTHKYLPPTTKPISYDLTLRIILESKLDEEELTAPGSVSIRVKCMEATDQIVMHADVDYVTILPDTVKVAEAIFGKPTNRSIPVKNQTFEIENDFYIIHLATPCKVNWEYYVDIGFIAEIGTEKLVGLYLSTYTDPVTNITRMLEVLRPIIFAHMNRSCGTALLTLSRNSIGLNHVGVTVANYSAKASTTATGTTTTGTSTTCTSTTGTTTTGTTTTGTTTTGTSTAGGTRKDVTTSPGDVHFKLTSANHPLGNENINKVRKNYWDNPIPHAIYTENDLKIEKTHHQPKQPHEHLASFAVKCMRTGFDITSRYKGPGGDMTKRDWLNRCLFLETVAGVPGMVAGMARHLKSLRSMNRDFGWIHTLLEEAENERMHLLIFMRMKDPGLMFRMMVIGAQGVFFNAFFLTYLITPKTCHRFVGYLEEEAVKTYTGLLEDMDGPEHLQDWGNEAAPSIAISYYKLHENATVRDVIKCIRADEAHHRDVNHAFAALDSERDPNPFLIKKLNEIKQNSTKNK